MKVTSIEIANFKAIGERVVIPIKPITLIFGANSAGKSSVMQCLAMLAQSLAVTKNTWGTCLLGKGTLVDVGNYRNFIHAHDTSKSFECKFNFDMAVNSLFDSLLPYDLMATKDLSLNQSAQKFKNILADFMQIALSFRFHYDTSEKTTSLWQIGFFLDDALVFTFAPSDWDFRPNTDHIFWEAYWNVFKEEIYNKLYAYPRAVAEGKVSTVINGDHVVKRHPKEVTTLLQRGMASNPKSIFEIYSLMYPDEPFYQELTEQAIQGGNEIDLVFQLYTFEANEQENSDFEQNHLTEFAGFLPTKFAYMKHEEFLCEEFIESMHYDSGHMESNVDYFHPEQLMVLVATHVQYFLGSFSYLGPLRKGPDRFYVKEDASESSASAKVDDIAHLLAYDNDVVRRVNEELVNLHTGYNLKIEHLTDSDGIVSGVFLVQFVDQKTGVAASIKDVGFGFSQILPVIVRCCTARDATVLIEQPELHLHPALQAELGDMLIRSSTKRQLSQKEYQAMLTWFSASENQMPNNWVSQDNHFFIETHSEHLILRLLRRIREHGEGELPADLPPLSPDDLTVLYVQPGDNGAKVTHIPVTADGEFAVPWPGGFFAERAKELF